MTEKEPASGTSAMSFMTEAPSDLAFMAPGRCSRSAGTGYRGAYLGGMRPCKVLP